MRFEVAILAPSSRRYANSPGFFTTRGVSKGLSRHALLNRAQPTEVNFRFHEPEALADFLHVEETWLAPQAHFCRLGQYDVTPSLTYVSGWEDPEIAMLKCGCEPLQKLRDFVSIQGRSWVKVSHPAGFQEGQGWVRTNSGRRSVTACLGIAE